MRRLAHTALILALLALPTCSEEPPPATPPEPPPATPPEPPPAAARPAPVPPPAVSPPAEELPLPKWFERSLAPAPRSTREAVLHTCRRWTRPGGSCEPIDVRRAQIRCWRQRGELALKHAQSLGLKRRRAIDHKIMLVQDLCMEMAGWKKLEARRRT